LGAATAKDDEAPAKLDVEDDPASNVGEEGLGPADARRAEDLGIVDDCMHPSFMSEDER
jgi:hypothetical protein